MARGRIIVVGSLNEDVVLRVDRIPLPGETVRAASVARAAGGKGANQAVAASRAGATVQMLGCVGRDDAGRRQLDALRAENVDTTLVEQLDGTATGTAQIAVGDDGENTIIIDAGANGRLTPDDLDAARDAIFTADVLLTQLEVPLETVTRAVELARAGDTRPIVTLAPAQAVCPEFLQSLDPLLVNEHEAAIVLGEAPRGSDPQAQARQLLELGVSSVVITLGARGAVLADADGIRALPAHAAEEIRDTTGAGDAFAGALAAALASGRSLSDAVAVGLIAGAGAVSREGAR